MARHVEIIVDGRKHQVNADATLAAALLDLGIPCRTSVSGELRAPLCGMGICYECRVTIDEAPNRRSCLAPVRDGMRVSTRAAASSLDESGHD
jgi:sarcosine oxidase subunit alpha